MSETMKIVIEGEFRAGRAFLEAKQGVQELRVETQRAGEIQTRMGEYADLSAQKMVRGFWQITRAVALVDMAFNRLEVSQMILSSAQERLTYAQEKYGVGSRQAQLASDELARVTMYVERANIRAALATGAMVMQLFMETGLLKEINAVKLIYIAKTAAATLVDWGHAAALWSKAHAINIITFGLAAAAAAVSYFAYQTMMGNRQLEEMKYQAEAVKNAIGEAPSSGLVKSFEDLGRGIERLRFVAMPTFNISVGALEEDIDRVMGEIGRRIKTEVRSVM